jgi:exopolysaccharide biosynthesis polyprenyl glycosylphosphotransferase
MLYGEYRLPSGGPTEAARPHAHRQITSPPLALRTTGSRVSEALRAPAVQSLRRIKFLAEFVGATVATLIVAMQAATPAASALALTFLVFFVSGTTLGRGSHWALLTFTNALASLMYRAGGAVVVWVVLDVAAIGAPAAASSLALAAVAASAAGSFTRRLVLAPTTRIAVVGSDRSAEALRHELRLAGVTDRRVIGIVAAGPEGVPPRGEVPVLGAVAGLAGILACHDIDLLLIDGDAARTDVYDQLAETCLGLPVRVCELAQFYEDALGRVDVGQIGSAWFRYIMHPRFRSPDTLAKRALDLTIALAAGVVFGPVLLVCALAIKLGDGGPVFFRQRRIGNRGEEFTMLKLRTMRSTAAVARWSSADDDRITPIGRLLRRSHLDEVPQLINVLRGEMSVVGPRPEQPEFVERLERTLPHYNRRHLIKPGLTGWAQVRCGYAGSDEGSALKLCNDLFYLKHQSLGLDLAILVETARTLIADRQFPEREAPPVPVTDEALGRHTTPLSSHGAVAARKIQAPARIPRPRAHVEPCVAASAECGPSR